MKPSKMLPVLYAGVLTGVISSVPILNFVNCCCCAGILAGGILGVFFYKQHFNPQMPQMTSGDCLSVGALTGLVGAIVSFLLSGMFLALFGNVAKDFILHQLQNSNLPFPPNSLDEFEHSLQDMETGFSLLNFIFNAIIDPIFGLLGGLIGWLIFKPKEIVYVQQIIQQPIPPPQEPPLQQ